MKAQATTTIAASVVPPYQTTAGTRARYPGTCLDLTGISLAPAEIA